jgi:serine phosphatase RsbU (regulator of sigma subunit)/anti-sigma regulatory factor (Ser/Thr protein kinase)
MMRARSRWREMRNRLLAWAVVPTVLVLAAAAIAAFLAFEQVREDEIVLRQRERAYLSANRLREEITKLSGELAVLARTEALYHSDPAGQRQALVASRRRLSVFDGGVVLLDSFGRVLGAEPFRGDIFRADWSSRPFFRQLLSGGSLVLSDSVPDGPDDTPVVVAAVPITSPDGEFLGAMAGLFRLGEPTVSAFYASLVRLRMGESGTAYLVDGQGRVIYHQDLDRIGDSLAGDAVVTKALMGELGAFRRKARGQGDVIVGYTPVPGTPWGLVVEEEWSALTSTSRGYERFLFILLVMGIVMPSLGFGLLARVRRDEAAERAELEQELRIARIIQQTLLPKESPDLPGWHILGHYQPAQAVGGDFYDYLHLPQGRLGLLIGDVTDKGVPAALVMATTRSLLRTVAQTLESPGEVLREVNELLVREIPPHMFVTCLYAVLDPATGHLRYANAGHNLPLRSQPGNGHVGELRARGMPLGLMSGMEYEELESTIGQGECVLFYSDGLTEAHNPRREMFGGPRLKSLLCQGAEDCPATIERLLAALEEFTGRGWQQEDDVTMVSLQRSQSPASADDLLTVTPNKQGWRWLDSCSFRSEPGGERQVMRFVAEAVADLDLSPRRLERLKTAVAETAMNAIEHGNRSQPDLTVDVGILASPKAVAVRITDQGAGPSDPQPQVPDLEAKIAGRQSPRGWGLFLTQNMVDRVNIMPSGTQHTVELVLRREGGQDAEQEA